MTYSNFKDDQYGNKFNSIYDLHQDIIKFKKEFNKDIIYWSTFWDKGDNWFRSWRSDFKDIDAENYYSWIWNPDHYNDSDAMNYDIENYGIGKYNFIISLVNKGKLDLLTDVFNDPVDKIFNLRVFL